MPRFLARLLGQPAPPPVNRAKPGPQRRAADHRRIIEKTRQLRFELGLPWRI